MNNHIDILASFEGQLEKIASEENPAVQERREGRRAAGRLGAMSGEMLTAGVQAGRRLAQSGDTAVHRGAQAILGKDKKRKFLGVPLGGRVSRYISRRRGAALGKTLGRVGMDLKHVRDDMNRDTSRSSNQGQNQGNPGQYQG